ncbi:MAG: hypothetical protein WKF71_19375 [Pyrinomonadaceae bacterium]
MARQTYVNVFHPTGLEAKTNIVLQFFHVETMFIKRGRVQADGRILLGTMGDNGGLQLILVKKGVITIILTLGNRCGGLDDRGNPVFRKNVKPVGPAPDTSPIKQGGFRSRQIHLIK